MQRRGHPTTGDQLFPYGDGADEGGHKEAGGKEVISQEHTLETHTRTHILLTNGKGEQLPEWILALVFSGQMLSVQAPGTGSWMQWRLRSVSVSLEHSHIQPYKSAVSVKWPRAKQRWVRHRLIRARQGLIKCSCCRLGELWGWHLTLLQRTQWERCC